MTKTLNWAAGDAVRPLSAAALYLAAAVLQGASNVLTRLAERLTVAEAVTAAAHTVEFHPVYRDSGAPEGALYVNGKLVGFIPGVTRL
jgi:hypothetical protein